MSKSIFVSGEDLVIDRVFLGWKERISRIIDRGHYEVACSQEAHAHYGDKFTRTDACLYFIRGALSETFRKSLREKENAHEM
ncbi:hypothetical protein [Morganella morganii]|uniref:hypothetical protein n=1 Tax=Morganella morganii TaxID=582 RepID=UPI001DB0C081|nr:hypothetical protein [Salmonella enterica subsp. enterica]EHD6504452.1 hypothetical protein [Salmonella enterica subsp. enterica serovar Orion]